MKEGGRRGRGEEKGEGRKGRSGLAGGKEDKEMKIRGRAGGFIGERTKVEVQLGTYCPRGPGGQTRERKMTAPW